MSVATKLAELGTDISNAYTAIAAKGGTVPANKNTNNLSTAIASISGGGGSGPEPLCFETVDSTLASNAQSLTITNEGGNAPVLQYSYNKNTWTNWDYSALPFGGTTKLYIRGMNMSGFSKSYSVYSKFGFSGNPLCKCSGDIMSLINYNIQEQRLLPYEFIYLFERAYELTTPPELPGTGLSSSCYFAMFKECISLTTAPALPATTLSDSCYNSMFYNCSSLTTPPELPATKLWYSCYSNMFYNCSSLTTAPALPATTLSDGCYSNMFNYCTSLASAPALPATTLANSCYYEMFYWCSSLTTAPALPATTLKYACYSGMFRNCTSLSTVPALPATTLETNCCRNMFKYCSNIKMSETQEGEYQNAYTFGTTPSSTYAGDMFADTGGTFTGTPTAQTYYTSNTIVSA